MRINVNSCPWRPCGCLCRALALLLLVPILGNITTALGGSHAYGENFVRSGSNWWSPEAGVMDKPGESSIAGSETDYRRQLEELQTSSGPYSDSLAEPLTGLARTHLAGGDIEEADRLYRHALHIVRINDGLYSERQIPIVQELLGLYRTTGDLHSLDQRYDYYYRLYGNGEPPYTEMRLRAALGYLRWQREALRLGMDNERHQRLLNLCKLNEELLAAVSHAPEVTPSQYNDVVLSQLRNLYLVEDRIQPRIEKIGVVETAPAFGGEWEQSDFERKRLETMQRGALSQGARLLSAAIERSGDSVTPRELAKLHLELGDWYQWHGSRNAAPQYSKVLEILNDAGQQDLLEHWLGQPVELPDNGVFWQPPVNAAAGSGISVETRFDVSASGRITNLTGSVRSPENEAKASRLKRELRKTRFRPRWINGAAEAVTGVQRTYEWFD